MLKRIADHRRKKKRNSCNPVPFWHVNLFFFGLVVSVCEGMLDVSIADQRSKLLLKHHRSDTSQTCGEKSRGGHGIEVPPQAISGIGTSGAAHPMLVLRT